MTYNVSSGTLNLTHSLTLTRLLVDLSYNLDLAVYTTRLQQILDSGVWA